ncbi:hypothetical protein BGZ76_004141 [Entomortierella beljakovae]|nr:hypothetical protein BGZ76_004141 [Entomortierella beljakovae]
MKGHEPTGSEDSLEQVLSHNRVMGVPLHGYRSQSLSTDGKEDWFEEEEETPGSYFSHTRWSYLCCTKPGLLKTFKHSLTVIFGLFTIIAIGITASGKFRNRSRVSDYIPTNLTNAIMEAQVVVIKDFDRFQRSKRDYGQQLNSFNPLISRRDSVDSQSESRIPIWTGPVHTHCLHEKCDIEHFGEKYFAFIHAESFGISLDKNWPSLCNSCIEISINRFVYNTKVRILGDLLLCPAGQSETTESNPSSHLTELAAISPLPTRASNTNATSNTTTATMTTTATHTLTAKTPGHEIPVASTKRHKFSSERPKYPLSSSNSIPSSTLTKDPKPSDLKPREQIEGSKMSSRRMYRQGNDHTKKGHQKQHMMARNQLSHRDLIAQFGSSTSALPYLIVDPATFTNLTVFEAQEELQKLKFLRVHFRFVLCDV